MGCVDSSFVSEGQYSWWQVTQYERLFGLAKTLEISFQAKFDR